MLPLYICVIAIGAVIMTIVYTRKILFNWRYWVMIAASVAVGLVLHITFLDVYKRQRVRPMKFTIRARVSRWGTGFTTRV